MIGNYFTVAWRNFRKGQLFSFINVIGLAIGIGCSILIFLYVTNELSYDRFFSKADRIYRVNEFFEGENGSGERSSSIPFPMAESMAIDFADKIEDVVRFFDFQSPVLTVSYETREKTFNERNFYFVDSAYHKVFDLELIRGNSSTALINADAVVISESTAKKYFENEDPMGKLLRFQEQIDLLVTGVYKDMPSNSHFHADFLASFSTLKTFYNGQYPQNWHWNPCWTYLLLKEGVDPSSVEVKFPGFIHRHVPQSFRDDITLRLQALTDIHLDSHLEFEMEPNGNRSDIYQFSGIAVFVLLIACMNFMNLSTARSMKRAKEVGMRKAIGGQTYQLMIQFMTESVMITFLSVIVSIGLVLLALPYFNSFAERELSINLASPTLLIGLVSIGLFVGVASGIYPAIVLTSFSAVKVLKSNHVQSKGSFRKVLVIVQFTISIVLIIASGVAIRQVAFLESDGVGFQRDHIVMLPVIGTPIGLKYRTFADEALTFTGIESVTAVEEVVGAKHQGGNYQFEGMEAANLFSRLKVRHDFLKTFNIPLLAGRDYSIDFPGDDSLSIVVNQKLIKGFNWSPDEAIGKLCTFGRFRGQIIGVTKDFNFASKHEPVGPLVMELSNSVNAFELQLKYMAVRLAPGKTQEALGELERLWKSFLPGRPFDYFFLDNELNNLYKAESNLIHISITFSLLAVIVACLGLFGLASFNAEQRKREISIRKVMGSSVPEIIMLILSDYIKLLIVSILIACPLAYLAMTYWLDTFAYRIDLPVAVFVLASLMTTGIALLTVSYKSILAARSNPIEALRSE